MVKSGVTYRMISDHLGSVRMIVESESGKVVQELDYGTFGEVRRDTNPGFQPFGFAGGLYDPDTGLVHFGAREYDARTGRFLSKDPLSVPEGGDFNSYRYVGSNPVNNVDPMGLWYLGISAGGYISVSPVVSTFTAEKGTYVGYNSNGGATATPYTSNTTVFGPGIGGSVGGSATINAGWGDNPAGNFYGLSLSLPGLGSVTGGVSSSGFSLGYANGPGFQPYVGVAAGNTQLDNVPGTPDPYQSTGGTCHP